MVIKTFILSLPKDVERRHLCRVELESLGLSYEFSDATCGEELKPCDLQHIYCAEANRIKFKRPLSHNEIVCTLGHRRIWQKIVDSNEPVGLVLEDDATFIQDPGAFLDGVSRYPEMFDGVMIKLDGLPRKNARALRAFAGQNLVLSDRLPSRTTGYLIGRRAAKQLLATDAPIGRPIDIDLKFYWEHKVPILTLDEKMVAERPGLDSNIETYRNSNKPGSSLSRFIRNLVYQFKYTRGRLSHPLKPDMIDGLQPLLNAENGAQFRS